MILDIRALACGTIVSFTFDPIRCTAWPLGDLRLTYAWPTAAVIFTFFHFDQIFELLNKTEILFSVTTYYQHHNPVDGQKESDYNN